MNDDELRFKRKARRELAVGIIFIIALFVLVIIDAGNKIGIINRFNTVPSDEGISQLSGFTKFIIFALLITYLLLLLIAAFALASSKDKPLGKGKVFFINLHNIFNIIPVVLTIFLAVDAFFISPVQVSGNSMANTLSNGDILLTSHRKQQTLEKGDIIILDINIDGESNLIIKRIYATEGDVITFKNVSGVATLTVNGKSTQMGPVAGHANYEYIETEYALKRGEYYVVGDHYTNSTDSRSRGIMITEGENKNAEICGKMIFSLKPFGTVTEMDPLID